MTYRSVTTAPPGINYFHCSLVIEERLHFLCHINLIYSHTCSIFQHFSCFPISFCLKKRELRRSCNNKTSQLVECQNQISMDLSIRSHIKAHANWTSPVLYIIIYIIYRHSDNIFSHLCLPLPSFSRASHIFKPSVCL